MKILMYSGFPVLPARAGNTSRILALSRAIRAQGHDLWLAVGVLKPKVNFDQALYDAEFGAGRVQLMPSGNHYIGAIGRRSRRYAKQLRILLNRPDCHYDSLDGWYSHLHDSALKQLHEQHHFDLVIAEYVFHSAALEVFPGSVRKVIDTHDSFADRHKPYVTKRIHDYFYSIRPDEEARGFRRADAILAIQPEEAKKFRHQLGENPANPEVLVVNHFLDVPDEAVPTRQLRQAMFLASRGEMNVHALRAFIQHVLPIVLAQMPDFRLMLVGGICEVPEDHRALIRLGQVETLADAFAQAPLLINPMQVGTGINIKMLDAMAAGVPVLSTETGARGLSGDYLGSVDVVADDDYQGFADRLVGLLQDEARRREMGRIAHANALRWNAEQNRALRWALESEIKE